MELDHYVTVAEAAEKLDIAPRVIRYKCKHGLIQGCEKIGGIYFIPLEWADRYKKKRAKSRGWRR